MRVLIVGCGDVGSRLAKKLLATGAEVFALKRDITTLPAGVRGITADICEPTSLFCLRQMEVDYLVVATTAGGFSEERYQQVYVDGLRNVLAVLQPLRRLLLVSSTSVYGQSGSEWVDENSVTEPASFSGQKQLAAEQLADQADCASTVVRFSGIYGPGRTRLIAQVYAGQHTAPEPLHYSNRIHVDDCAGVLAFLIATDWQGEALGRVYLASDHSPSLLHEVKEWMAGQLSLQGHWQEVVAPSARGGSKRCSSQRLQDLGYEFQHADFKSGYAPVIAEFLAQKKAE
jgi:nucleoside-diphosphate-sugar epimerase